MLISDTVRVKDLVKAITDKEKELEDAKYIVKYHPAIIRELEKELFHILSKEEVKKK